MRVVAMTWILLLALTHVVCAQDFDQLDTGTQGRIALWMDQKGPYREARTLENAVDAGLGPAVQEFFIKEFSKENLDFLTAVEEYNAFGPSAGLDPATRQRKQVYARKIVRTFVSKGAETEVNLSNDIKYGILRQFEAGNLPDDLFDGAEAEVSNLAKRDTMKRFQNDYEKKFGKSIEAYKATDVGLITMAQITTLSGRTLGSLRKPGAGRSLDRPRNRPAILDGTLADRTITDVGQADGFSDLRKPQKPPRGAKYQELKKRFGLTGARKPPKKPIQSKNKPKDDGDQPDPLDTDAADVASIRKIQERQRAANRKAEKEKNSKQDSDNDADDTSTSSSTSSSSSSSSRGTSRGSSSRGSKGSSRGSRGSSRGGDADDKGDSRPGSKKSNKPKKPKKPTNKKSSKSKP